MKKRFEFMNVKVAAVKAESVFLDIDKSTDKAVDLIYEAAKNGAKLIAFPECFIPSFPNWYETLGESPQSRKLDVRLFKESIEIDGSHVHQLKEACKKTKLM